MTRRPLTIACAGATLAAIAHPADGATGIVIVAGGPQTRAGAHRGFVALADALASAGHPVLRFDRRGLGDSDGDDPGFRGIGPDIAAARAALCAAFPAVRRVVGFGLCDGAAALAIEPAGFDALILANPWTHDGDRAAATPPRAAIAAHYRRRLLSPRHWVQLLRRGFSVRKALGGLARMASHEPASATATAIAAGLARFPGRTLVLLAEHDNSARAFEAAWSGPGFAAARTHKRVTLEAIAGATHTFPGNASAQALAAAVTAFVAKC